MTNEKDKPEFLKEQPQKPKLNLDQHKPIFQGTNKRNEMMRFIVQIAREKLPMNQKKFINIVAFQTGLTTRKVQEDYISLLLDVEILQNHNSDYELGNAEKGI